MDTADDDPRRTLELKRLLDDSRDGERPEDERSAAVEELLTRAMTRMRAISKALETPGGPSGSELLQTAWVERIAPALREGGVEISDSEHFFAWFARMTRRTRSNLRRNRAVQKRGGGVTHTSGETASSEKDGTASLDLASAVGALSEDQQSVILVKVVEGRSRKETAELLGITEAQVRTREVAGLARLRALLPGYA